MKATHLVGGGGVLLCALGILTGGLNPDFEAAQERASLIKAQRLEQSKQLDELQLSLQYTQAAAAIANARYQDGCAFVVQLGQPENAVSIQDGEPVVDFHTHQPLPDGTVVCDFQGNTGVMRSQVVRETAFTGDNLIVEAAANKAGFYQEGQTAQSNEWGG